MIAFFDTETTGLPTKKGGDLSQEPHVLQLAVSLYDKMRRPVFELSTLVRLSEGTIINAQALETHGIDFELTKRYGVEKRQAVQLLRYAFDRASLIVAHNLQFDEKLLTFETSRTELPSLFEGRRKFCTMEGSTEVLKLPATPAMLKWGYGPYKNPNLAEAYRYFFSEDFEGAHDALADTRACARVYFELVDRGYVRSEPDMVDSPIK